MQLWLCTYIFLIKSSDSSIQNWGESKTIMVGDMFCRLREQQFFVIQKQIRQGFSLTEHSIKWGSAPLEYSWGLKELI